MKSDWKKFIVCFVIITSFFHFETAQTQTTEFTYDDTDFELFQSSLIYRTAAQTQCSDWGGNLATIKSAVEDSLLLYSSPDLDITFTCHIGLNDIDSEAGTNGSAFIWIDGSTSSYRNWGNLMSNYPVATNDFDCVRFRYRDNPGVLSQGWVNAPCNYKRNCYFCSKPGTSNGCDLTYDSYCYKVLEVSTPINWLDAQSSCAIWGGDLTSITGERENNYLNTLITSSVGNCWIGLNDRDVEGTYAWIDGTAVSYTNWTGTPPNVTNSDCVQINNTGNGVWESVSCDITLNAILCKRESTITTESRYVVLTNGAVLYQPLISDRFLYNPTLTLVYGIGDFSGLVWKYSTRSDLSDATTLSANFFDPQIGFSSLTIDNSMQGYYYYELSNVASSIVGLYDDSITIVATEGTTYTYISGVDRQDVLLLCDPNDGGSLNLKWNDTFANPVNIYSERSQFQSEAAAFICTRDTTTIVTTRVSVIVPEIFVKYYQILSSTHTDTSSTNTATIPLSTQQVSLSTNLVGHWNIPGDTNTSSSTVDIGTFLQSNAGLYTLYTNNWDGVIVITMQINILSSPALTAMTPEQEFIFDDTRFGYFSDTPGTNWLNAQLNCISWGGSLATIKSEEEDKLLLYTTTDTRFACYIGLNDILNEANGVEGDYTWVDGSSGLYRNFEQGFPSSIVDHDCVRFRYRMSSSDLSQGWVNGVCSSSHNCHFCTKSVSAISSDCDLIHDGSCYKVFTVNTPINWLDAQSSCAIWGGDLTSITSERENNYLNTIIPDTVSSYWIGLNDRSEEDTLTWIDGTSYTQPGFVTVQSNIEANDCVHAINDNNWYPVICTSTQTSFICKATSEITAVERFGELIIGGLDFNSLDVNQFIYKSLTLACGGQENDVITWRFSENSDLSSDEALTATYSNTGTGSSWLNVENTKQGYYQCQISSSSYTVGVYDTSVTTVALPGYTYTYLEGVDRENILLLCDPMDNGSLSTLKWGVSYSNPLNIHSVRNTLPTQSTVFSCSRGADAIVSIFLSVTVPTLVVKYELFVAESNKLVHPSINDISIPLETQDVSLTMNLVGKWSTPNGVNSTGSTFQISEFMNENVGVYTFYTNNWDGVEVGIQIHVTSVPAVVAPVPTISYIFDGTQFGYFTLPEESINWVESELGCVAWNGHLATIRSLEEDTLMLHSIVNIQNVSCFIGLNDRESEAMEVAIDFVWADDSNSTYRQFGNSFSRMFPMGSEPDNENDCVRFRYTGVSDMISNGWLNRGCNVMRSCYFCTSRPVVHSDCDLIYDGSCYKVFEVSTPITWLDAQSSCAIWGGDLTSITTERENNYLNTIIPNTVSSYWIGLNDRGEEGTYTWIDGTSYTQPGFVTLQSNIEANDCVHAINDSNWYSVICTSTQTSFICKATSVILTVERFGELINEGLNFQTINSNTFLFNSLTLACGGEESSTISWKFSQISDFTTSDQLTATSSSLGTGLSWIYVDISKQGYYQCQIGNGVSRIIGLYDQSITTVAVSGSTYSYTVGIDRVDALLLCNSSNDSIPIASLMWGIENGGTWTNPINISEWSSTSPQQVNQLNCLVVESVFISVTANIYVPTLTVSTTESSIQFSAVYPASNTISLKVRTVDFSLSANLPGRWRLPDDTFTSEQSISYQTLDYQYFGLYQYLIVNWDGNEVIAIQITLIPDGFVVTDPISISNAPIQNDSIIIVTEDDTMIDCAVSSVSDDVQWMFKSQTDGMVTNKTSSATFSMETGLSTLVVSANEPGDYSCIINARSVYRVSVVDENSLVRVDSFANPLQQVDFTMNSALSQLYYPSSAIIQSSVSDSDIQWTNDVVESGDDKVYTPEYPNPVDLNTVFSNVGGGVQTFSCFYRMSPVTLLGSVQLALRDTATITVSYQGSSMTFGDVNPIFPSAQEISILVGTTDVMLTCSLSECIWLVSDVASVITTQTYTIPAITDSYNVNISLMRMTDTSVTYTTAHITITSMSSPQTQSSVAAIAAIIIVIILLAVVAVIFTLLLVFFIVRKRGKSKLSNSNMYNIDAKSTSSELPLKTSNVLEYKDDIPLQNFNPAYLPNETLTKPEIPEQSPIRDTLYQNIAKVRKVDSPVPKRAASPVVDPKTQLIPLDAFKMHMNRLWQRENALQEEYESLGGKDHRYPCSHAKIEENKIKNRFKLMYPYDKSRVVLSVDPNGDPNLDYVNASYIPGVYVKEKFIGAQAPKENTLQDFWKMIIENKVVNIVMVTNLIESGRKKCEQYFPLKIGEKLEFGPYEIIVDKEEVKIGYTIKDLSVHYMGKVTNLRHFHFTAWPDHDVPTLYDELLLFVSKVQEGRMKGRAPILVHCSAGVGRTGTFITLYNLSAAIQQTKPISIYNVVHAMREHRPQMVQTYSQYKFIYLSVLEMLLGNTSIPTEEFLDTFGLYMQSETQGYVSVFYQQYSELNYQCEKGFDPVCSSALEPENEKKNPVKDILPCDSNRVVLESSNSPGDYINATSLDNGEIILTVNPTSDTVRDFNQLVYMVEPSLVVMLCSNKELQHIEQGKSHRVVYWPKQGETLNFDSFTVSCPKSDKTSHFIRNKMNIHSCIDNLNRPFTQIISNQWNDKEETNLENTIHLIKTILEFRKRDPAHPVIIHCDDGAGKSGVVYTVCKAIKDSTEKGFIDIFHTVKKLRNDRMNSVTTLTYFVSCFSLMNEYCSKSQ